MGTVAVQTISSMSYPRIFANAVVLPNGAVRDPYTILSLSTYSPRSSSQVAKNMVFHFLTMAASFNQKCGTLRLTLSQSLHLRPYPVTTIRSESSCQTLPSYLRAVACVEPVRQTTTMARYTAQATCSTPTVAEPSDQSSRPLPLKSASAEL